LNSRNVEFSSELSMLGGVDIVLNSLTSAGMLAASLSCLSQDGSFVEVGKRDIWSQARIAQVRAALCALDACANLSLLTCLAHD
jgi:hypothetical protein